MVLAMMLLVCIESEA
uniref:BLTX766 n=1 Tax=Nephila pilipes TaxID=299642 RepID=A0A076L364_NEPPI|nr:BLTX766 [Nephila pilipes]